MVAEIKSGLSFEIVHGPRDSTWDLRLPKLPRIPMAGRHFVKVGQAFPERSEVGSTTSSPAYLARLALGEQEELSVHPETVAIEFQANGLAHGRWSVPGHCPTSPRCCPNERHTRSRRSLRPIAPLIRMWSISDDAKRRHAWQHPDLTWKASYRLGEGIWTYSTLRSSSDRPPICSPANGLLPSGAS